MNEAQQAIEEAYRMIVASLTDMHDRYMREAEYGAVTYPDYEGANKHDAYMWFVEGLT